MTKHPWSTLITSICLLATGSAVHAAEWRINSATYGPNIFTISGQTFSDGVYKVPQDPLDPSQSLITSSSEFGNGSSAVSTLNFLHEPGTPIYTSDSSHFQLSVAGQARAPEVDVGNLRADFSALFYIGYNNPNPFKFSLGWNVGAAGWVPLTANADGSYTAQWLTPYPTNEVLDQGGSLITINLSPVPEVSTPLLALAALGVWAGMQGARRRASAPRQG